MSCAGISCGEDNNASLAITPVLGAAGDRMCDESVERINVGLGAPAATDNPCAFLQHIIDPLDDRNWRKGVGHADRQQSCVRCCADNLAAPTLPTATPAQAVPCQLPPFG